MQSITLIGFSPKVVNRIEKDQFNVLSLNDDSLHTLEAIKRLAKTQTDAFVINAKIPKDYGLTLARLLKQYCQTPRILVGRLRSRVYISQVLAVANGYCLSASSQSLRLTIKAAHQKTIFVAPPLNLASPNGTPQRFPLSNAELEVLNWLAQGKNNKEIAQTMMVSEETVKTRLQDIYKKLSAKNRVTAVVVAMKCGLI